MNDMLEKIKELVQKAGPFRIGVVVVCGILLLLLSYGDMFGKKETVSSNYTKKAEQFSGNELTDYRERMERQVKSILEQAEGVGRAEVMITLKASREKVTLKDYTTKEKEQDEETVMTEDENNCTEPYVVQEVEPEIEGIVVVCEGGGSPSVQREIIAGISALFPVESHKIKVMKSKEAK